MHRHGAPAGRQGRGPGPGRGVPHHDAIHALLDAHEAIERQVVEIDNGVITVTTSDDPEVAERIRLHVRQMEQRMESGHGMRWWDPLFAELFRHHEAVQMKVEEIPNGVRVTETSDDPEVAKLIKQHATRGVSEFVAQGYARAHQATPLPDGYREMTARSDAAPCPE
jgi:hypothetical protein